MESTPTVTFIVPCYNLAHHLTECVESILAQTFTNFEVLILDDCSPDNTSEVARGIADPRVCYIRHSHNLGHVRNYNFGLRRARGRYVWLISADDRLRSADVLGRFVSSLESDSAIGFVFCRAMSLIDGRDSGIVEWADNGDKDFVSDGRDYICNLLAGGNRIASPTVLARASAYGDGFPLDLPHACDWYVWLTIASRYSIAYAADPMVSYRLHAQNMTLAYSGRYAKKGTVDEIKVLLRIEQQLAASGASRAAASCAASADRRLADLASSLVEENPRTTFGELVDLVRGEMPNSTRCERRIASALISAGDRSFWRGANQEAKTCYGAARRCAPHANAAIKYYLISAGRFGRFCRDAVRWMHTCARAVSIRTPSAARTFPA